MAERESGALNGVGGAAEAGAGPAGASGTQKTRLRPAPTDLVSSSRQQRVLRGRCANSIYS